MIIRRKHWPLLIALCLAGPALGLAAGLFFGWPSCPADKGDGADQRVEAQNVDAERDDHRVALPDGTELALDELAPDRPVAIVVMKGTWCRVCQDQLVELTDRLDEVSHSGGAVFGLSADKPEANQRLMDQRQIGFPVLSDADPSVLCELGLWDDKRDHAIPGVVFVDEDGQIEHVHRGRYPDRPQTQMILERLERM